MFRIFRCSFFFSNFFFTVLLSVVNFSHLLKQRDKIHTYREIVFIGGVHHLLITNLPRAYVLMECYYYLYSGMGGFI